MPLPDISTAHSSVQEHVYAPRTQAFFCGNFGLGYEKRFGKFWHSFCIPKNAKRCCLGHNKICRGGLTIKAVAGLEPLHSSPINNELNFYHNMDIDSNLSSTSTPEQPSSSEDAEELDESEKLRRMRISKANKGNTPWNKGRKHSLETLRRIRERTKLAMQDPKVKMKLVNLGRAQSKETRAKIGVGVRMGWERRREKLMVQETCHFEWQNLIAEASRKGHAGEEELQWDAYKILDKELEQEWVQSIEQRKRACLRSNKRAPKSLEQRRKISEAIAAKWADPKYRDKVYSGLAKYHGTPTGVERKQRRRPTGDGQPRKMNMTNKKASEMDDSANSRTETKIQNLRSRLRKSNVPLYKDPHANSKFEMIKNIRAQRAVAENKKFEAITRAKLLIAEAESAANSLEAAATRSPIAQAALIETRKLIAEAVQSIKSIVIDQPESHGNGSCVPSTPTRPVNNSEREIHAETEDIIKTCTRQLNGIENSVLNKSVIHDLDFSKFSLQDLLNGTDEGLSSRADGYILLNGYEKELHKTGSGDYINSAMNLDLKREHSSFTNQVAEPNGSNRNEKHFLTNGAIFAFGKLRPQPKPSTITKKWVRGRLVEVAEGDEL